MWPKLILLHVTPAEHRRFTLFSTGYWKLFFQHWKSKFEPCLMHWGTWERPRFPVIVSLLPVWHIRLYWEIMVTTRTERAYCSPVIVFILCLILYTFMSLLHVYECWLWQACGCECVWEACIILYLCMCLSVHVSACCSPCRPLLCVCVIIQRGLL